MGVRARLSNAGPTAYVVLIVIGALSYFLASLFVRSYTWATDVNGIYHHDHWGYLINPVYFTYLTFAFFISILAAILYPFFLWSRVKVDYNQGRFLRKRYLLAGFLLPYLYQYGEVWSEIYGYPDFGSTILQVLSPPMIFDPFGMIGMVLPVAIIGFLLGIANVIATVDYERHSITYRVFLIPIILNLLVSIGFLYITVYGLATSGLLPLVIPFPAFTLGIFMYGRGLSVET